MELRNREKAKVVTDFIDTEAHRFDETFAGPSRLNVATMQYEPSAILDLKETLECHCQKAAKYVDFASDLTDCPWETVLKQLEKAKAEMERAKAKSKGDQNPLRKTWRHIGSVSTVLGPGLSAIPDELCVLKGGLAVIFSLARHSELNRLKILGAFENVPNVLEMARNKMESFPLDTANPKSIKLHVSVKELHKTLLKVLPVLIDKLVPGTFRQVIKSPFGTLKIDELLETVQTATKKVEIRADSLLGDLILDHYSVSRSIASQLEEVLRYQREMKTSLDSAHGKNFLMQFLMEQINAPRMGLTSAGRDVADMSDMGTALPGYTAEDLLKIIDVHHLRITHDATRAMRQSSTIDNAILEQAGSMITTPQMRELLDSPQPSFVVVDGHFDATQMGQISPLSFICAATAQMLRQQYQASAAYETSASQKAPASQQPPAVVVLEYYCSLHTSEADYLRGPQGLVRCLSMQLILALLVNEWISAAEPLRLPDLRDSEEELLAARNLDALCRLFLALLRLVPVGVSVFCFVDSWSAYEREDLWRADYNTVLRMFQQAVAEDQGPDDDAVVANFKLLLTSRTSCRWLDGFDMMAQKVSLRNREAKGRHWHGAGRNGLVGLARAATMSEAPRRPGPGPGADAFGYDRTYSA